MRGTRKHLPDLIEDIYDAAIEPSRWNDVMANINAFVGGQACGLFSKNDVSKAGVTHYYHGADPHFIQLYAETHSKFDPLTRLPPFGKVTAIPDLVTYDDYRKGRFYQEWLRPQGCADALNVVVDQTQPDCPVLLTVLPPSKRMVDEDMRRRIELLIPHAHRALMINRAIEVKHAQAVMFADALDGLSAGIFLLDAGCRIVHANTAGRHMVQADDVLRAVGGQLIARHAPTNQTLRDIFAAGGDVAAIARGLALPLIAHDGERFIAHVVPLTSVVRSNATAPRRAVAALFVRKAELDSQSCGAIIARTFELTPAELRVLLTIAEVGGVPETAETLRVADSTVKTHLHRVFAKTGASRQADLVKLVAGYSNPLAN